MQHNQENVFWITVQGKRFAFHTAGKEELDAGTELLLRYMELGSGHIILDLFCGYGVKGIIAATLAPQSHVHIVDSSEEAVDIAQANAALNFVKKRTQVYVSDGFSQIEKGRTFHTILFTQPEGMKKEAVAATLTDAKNFLKPNGVLYVSVIAGLRHFLEELLEKEFGSVVKIAAGKGYVLFAARQGDTV